jgi:hypothetical protein
MRKRTDNPQATGMIRSSALGSFLNEPDYSKLAHAVPNFERIKGPLEQQAEALREGFRAQLDKLQKGVKAGEQLEVYCWNGHDLLRVLSFGMPSHNVVVLSCEDKDGNPTHILAHMSAMTFTCKIRKLLPKERPRKIGFAHDVNEGD